MMGKSNEEKTMLGETVTRNAASTFMLDDGAKLSCHAVTLVINRSIVKKRMTTKAL